MDPSPVDQPKPIIIDGSRKAKTERSKRERLGLDFPLPGGVSVRLPYPQTRFFPTGPVHAADPTKVTIGQRFGYAPPLQTAVDRFHATLETGSDLEKLAAAIVVAWLMLTPENLGKFDPCEVSEMDASDAVVFVHRMFRLTSGLVDLDQDESGAFLLPLPQDLSEDQPEVTPPESLRT